MFYLLGYIWCILCRPCIFHRHGNWFEFPHILSLLRLQLGSPPPSRRAKGCLFWHMRCDLRNTQSCIAYSDFRFAIMQTGSHLWVDGSSMVVHRRRFGRHITRVSVTRVQLLIGRRWNFRHATGIFFFTPDPIHILYTPREPELEEEIEEKKTWHWKGKTLANLYENCNFLTCAMFVFSKNLHPLASNFVLIVSQILFCSWIEFKIKVIQNTFLNFLLKWLTWKHNIEKTLTWWLLRRFLRMTLNFFSYYGVY